MGNTLIRVEIAERRDAFIPKKERFSWVYAFFSPGKPDVLKRLQHKFWNEYLIPEFMAGSRQAASTIRLKSKTIRPMSCIASST